MKKNHNWTRTGSNENSQQNVDIKQEENRPKKTAWYLPVTNDLESTSFSKRILKYPRRCRLMLTEDRDI